MKKVSLFLFLIPIAIAGTYAGGIPQSGTYIDPETLVPLPPELIGEFEFPYNDDERHTFLVMEIYENNGFLFKWIGQKPNGWKDGIGKDYGQVIQEDGDYYFMAMGGGIMRGKAKIILNENGFSFLDTKDRELIAVRKREGSDDIE